MSIIKRNPTYQKVFHLLTQVALVITLTGALFQASLTPAHAAPAFQLNFECGNVTEIPQAECAALVTFYNSTNGAGWSNKTNWLNTNTPCSWHGVGCHDGSVIELSLYANQLSGSLPPALGNLANLQEFRLDDNQLSGSIPAELGNLTNLIILRLASNQLRGTIPSALGNLTRLEWLRLEENQLSGAIPPALGNLARLEWLFLANNQLSGAIPAHLGNLASLQWLFLHNNQLSGSIPAELGNFIGLNGFSLANNQLSGSIPAALCALPFTYGADFGYNLLTVSDACLSAAQDPDWAQTQTVPPTNVQAQTLANQQVQVSWTPISYTVDGGYYVVLDAPTPGGPYTMVGQTADKTASGITLPPLGPGAHHLVVRTFTPKHGEQQNDLSSDNSAEVLVVLNTPPLVVSATVTATQGHVLSILLNASDADADALSYALVSLPVHGLLSGTAPTLTYTPTADFVGIDRLTYSVSDGKATVVATVSVTVVAALPATQAVYLPLVQR